MFTAQSTFSNPPFVPRVCKMDSRALLFWSLVSRQTENCIFWPKPGARGQAVARLFDGGRRVNLRRAACVIANGAPPHVGAHAAHKCGHPACINPAHLSWKTARANQVDRADHARMTWRDISMDFIRPDYIERVRGAIAVGTAPGAIAAAFGMPVMVVHAIQARATNITADRPRVILPKYARETTPEPVTLAHFFSKSRGAKWRLWPASLACRKAR